MPHTPRGFSLIRDAIAAAESITVLEQLRTFAREQYAGREREDLEGLIDRRAAELAALAEQLPLDAEDGETYDGIDRDGE